MVKSCKIIINISERANTVCPIKSLFNDHMYPHITEVTYLKHSVWFMHWSNNETNQMNIHEISNTVCPLQSLFNEQMYPKSKQ